ncbi:uncharacterized protein ACO6RY_08200 [Pungitius sinensis]
MLSLLPFLLSQVENSNPVFISYTCRGRFAACRGPPGAPRHRRRGPQGPEQPACTLSVCSLFSSCDSGRILMMTISGC